MFVKANSDASVSPLPTSLLKWLMTPLILSGLSLNAQAATTMPVKSDWTVRDHVPLEKFIVQAHRGAGELAEENTLEAFELGWKLGCIPESDLRTTKDGV